MWTPPIILVPNEKVAQLPEAAFRVHVHSKLPVLRPQFLEAASCATFALTKLPVLRPQLPEAAACSTFELYIKFPFRRQLKLWQRPPLFSTTVAHFEPPISSVHLHVLATSTTTFVSTTVTRFGSLDLRSLITHFSNFQLAPFLMTDTHFGNSTRAISAITFVAWLETFLSLH